MARLRFFASAREAAGVASSEISGQTVAEVLEGAVARFGSEFEAVLATAAVWCNGEATEMHQSVSDDDEIAVLPPISGGT